MASKGDSLRRILGPTTRLQTRLKIKITPPSRGPVLWESHGAHSLIIYEHGAFKGYAKARTRDRAYAKIADTIFRELLVKLPLALDTHRQGLQNDLRVLIEDAGVFICFRMADVLEGFERAIQFKAASVVAIPLIAIGKVSNVKIRDTSNRRELALRSTAALLTICALRALTVSGTCAGVPGCTRTAWPKIYPKLGGKMLSQRMCPGCEVTLGRQKHAARIGKSRAKKRSPEKRP